MVLATGRETMEKLPNNVSYRENNHDGVSAGLGRVNNKMPVYTTDKRRNKFSQRTNKKLVPHKQSSAYLYDIHMYVMRIYM